MSLTQTPIWLLQRQPFKRTLFTAVAATLVLFFLYYPRHRVSSPRFSRTWAASQPHILDDINNHTLGFGNIFVVGLPSRSDRRDGMALQAALSNLHIEFRDGVRGEDVPDKAIPQTSKHDRLKGPSIGSWRAHMNVIREVVERNLSSALILEDDVDWDIRIRDQLRDFALSSHALTQPLSRRDGLYADPTFPSAPADFNESVADLLLDNLPATQPPTISAYGDDWDLMWLGHCGMAFAPEKQSVIPLGRVVQLSDVTAPAKKHLWSLIQPFSLVKDYPEHTRVVHHSKEGVCSLGYALSQKGARKLLREVGLRDVTDAFDILLRFYCEGHKGRRRHNCLTVQPSLFNHHRVAGPKSAASDIGNHEGFNEKSLTDMVRWSVRLNADTILEGEEFSDGITG